MGVFDFLGDAGVSPAGALVGTRVVVVPASVLGAGDVAAEDLVPTMIDWSWPCMGMGTGVVE